MADIERLYNEYYGFIYKFLLSKCKSPHLAEELTQETFYRAFINIKQLMDESKAVCWLCTIAKNLLYSHYNEQKRFCDSPDESESLPSERDTESEALGHILAEKALKIAESLETPYKEVFLLYIYTGLSFKDISLLFGKSESWARVTFYRTKEKIIKEINL
ncbi:MAG: RNA polymerase sigma factor [Clostridia bacterium]|nr:RNA polymerase sigma factor [Clostridia bacterium]